MQLKLGWHAKPRLLKVAIPLRGYVVCNQTRGGLRGVDPRGEASQSPYGAKWFATVAWARLPWVFLGGRNPLTGLSGLQRYPFAVVEKTIRVAIPLRG